MGLSFGPTIYFTALNRTVLRDIIVLVGMNGAGKTSLLQAIAVAIGSVLSSTFE
ncbi:MAG: ATP-binding protein [Cyanomargarita calcarea GSE-NOS-MK-12-04C]|uniref:ATP-binding protein n=1 Tax=Cyanomargarita calcarea GSE-NOS-MK-12-04C TaxID=2839659 RepID=A0A951QLX7_9CYAN|nr:ATP-binding protein [Cyanomargarita calcarea GSE-NOS-MK-12-04C]